MHELRIKHNLTRSEAEIFEAIGELATDGKWKRKDKRVIIMKTGYSNTTVANAINRLKERNLLTESFGTLTINYSAI